MHKLLRFLLLFIFSKGIAQQPVEFVLTKLPDKLPKHIGIRGNTAPLSWTQSIPLQKIAKDSFAVQLDFASEQKEIEYKFVLFDSDKNPTWESTENRILILDATKPYQVDCQWDVQEKVDVQTLPLLQPEQLLADLELIKTMVIEVHPGTYRYKSKEQIDFALSTLEAKFQKPRTYGEAYLAMSYLTATIQCDHTKVGLNNQGNIINSIIHQEKDKLPFTCKWIKGKMIVDYDATYDHSLPRGTEIISINGYSDSEILEAVSACIAADGATQKSRTAKAEIEGFDFRYNDFDVFFPLIFPIKNEKIRLGILPVDGGHSHTLDVQTMTRDERNQILTNRYPDMPKSRDDLWKFELVRDSIGVLTVNSFGLFGWKKMSLDYKQFLANTFAELKKKKAKHLIIDIRKNNGGADEMARELYSYLDKDLSTEITREGRSRYLDFPESLKLHVQTWGDAPWYFSLEADTVDADNGYFIFYEKKQKTPKKKRAAFGGKLYLLTSPHNASLAFYVANTFKKSNMGTIIGQETGGNLRDINGGQILFLRLPNTGIEIDFPVVGNFNFGDKPDSGVQPDILVESTEEDLIQQRDACMVKAFEIIGN